MNEALKKWCEKTHTDVSGITFLIDEYYVKTLGWSVEKAEAYAIELFENGTIEQIKLLAKKDE